MRSPYDIIKLPLVREKSTQQERLKKYVFLVDKKAKKLEIKRAIEAIYKVKVKDVNTLILPGKLKRVRYRAGYTPDYKKAVVTLKEGKISDQKI